MKKIVTTMADSASEAIQDVRNWYEKLGIELTSAPVASKCWNSDQVYRVVIHTE